MSDLTRLDERAPILLAAGEAVLILCSVGALGAIGFLAGQALIAYAVSLLAPLDSRFRPALSLAAVGVVVSGITAVYGILALPPLWYLAASMAVMTLISIGQYWFILTGLERANRQQGLEAVAKKCRPNLTRLVAIRVLTLALTLLVLARPQLSPMRAASLIVETVVRAMYILMLMTSAKLYGELRKK